MGAEAVVVAVLLTVMALKMTLRASHTGYLPRAVRGAEVAVTMVAVAFPTLVAWVIAIVPMMGPYNTTSHST